MAGSKGALGARATAVNALIGAHQEEYDGLLGDARVAAGLSRVPVRGVSVEQLRERAVKAEARAAAARAKLAELGVE